MMLEFFWTIADILLSLILDWADYKLFGKAHERQRAEEERKLALRKARRLEKQGK